MQDLLGSDLDLDQLALEEQETKGKQIWQRLKTILKYDLGQISRWWLGDKYNGHTRSKNTEVRESMTCKHHHDKITLNQNHLHNC
jgi:hypothetical protein